jgi:hypothetical protein
VWGGIGRAAWAARTFGFHTAYNALMRAAPGVAQGLQRLTRDTGRAGTCVGPAAAEYFRSVADDFETIAEHAGVTTAAESGGRGSPLYAGRAVLELGPGDTMGVSLVARLRGARACAGFDAFDIASRDRAYLEAIYGPIATSEGRAGGASAAWELLSECPHVVGPEALRRGGKRFDLVLSRAVLEHVKDLDGLFAVAREVSTDDAVWIHEVDLRDHGIEHAHPLDFLRFSEGTWRTMTSHTDAPSRERASTYLALGARHGLHLAWAGVSHRIGLERVREIRAELATPFRDMPESELAVLGLWLVHVGPAHPLAKAGANVPRIEDLPAAPMEKLSKFAQGI